MVSTSNSTLSSPRVAQLLSSVESVEPLLDYLRQHGALSTEVEMHIRGAKQNVAQQMQILIHSVQAESVILNGIGDHRDDPPDLHGPQSPSITTHGALGLLINALRLQGYHELASVLDNERRIQTPLEKSFIHSLAGHDYHCRRRRGQVGLILQVSAIKIQAPIFGLSCTTLGTIRLDESGDSSPLPEVRTAEAPENGPLHFQPAPSDLWIENPVVHPCKVQQSFLTRSSILFSTPSKSTAPNTGVAHGNGDSRPGPLVTPPRKGKSKSSLVRFFCMCWGRGRRQKTNGVVLSNGHRVEADNSPLRTETNLLQHKSHSEAEIAGPDTGFPQSLLLQMSPWTAPAPPGFQHGHPYNSPLPFLLNSQSTPLRKIGPPPFLLSVPSSPSTNGNAAVAQPPGVNLSLLSVIPEEKNTNSLATNSATCKGFDTNVPIEGAADSPALSSDHLRKAEILSRVSTQVYCLLQGEVPTPTISHPTSGEVRALNLRDMMIRFVEQKCGILLLDSFHEPTEAFVLLVCCTEFSRLKTLREKVLDGTLAKQLEKELFTTDVMRAVFEGVSDIRLVVDMDANELAKAEAELASN